MNMTFTQFIKQLSSEQVNTWWQTMAPNQTPDKVEEENWKYKLTKNGKALPFKWSIAELAKHHNIPFSNKDFDSNVANRDAFCEAFDFEIQEDLVYNDYENKGFQEFYSKRVSNQQMFQTFIKYGNNLVSACDINPYKIRMAISSDKKYVMMIVGMRVVLQYTENNRKPIIGFILQKEFVDKLDSKIFKSIYSFKGNDTSKVFVDISIENWSDISNNILENNLLSVKEQYELINKSKRATWNTEANTTNSVLKYLIFKNENVERWIENNKPIDYWVFQGNPKEFDIIKALEDNALKTWRVKAHKDKIKKGDKVILWAGGKNSGVYALATVDSEVSIMPEPEIEKQYYKDQTVYEDKERVFLKIDYNLFNQPILKSELEKYSWFSKMKVGSQGTNFTATKEEYESIKSLISKMNKLIINISWNSKDWKEESHDKSNHEWVKNGGIPFESWNFANDAEGNTEEHIFGYAKFTNNPKISGKSIFIFYSDKKIVGFYGNGAIVEKKVKDNVLNLRGDQNISFVLENKIENIVEKGYLEEGKRIGQGGFNYIYKNETVLKILDEALQLNPNQKEEILRLKEWFMKETQSNQSSENKNKSSNIPLNQILYGPPGTGKTYNTVLEAAKIVTGNETISYDEALKVFNENLNNQIEFITFHQNYSYEDFIQGLRPDTENGKDLSFEKKDGVFKRIADKAYQNLILSDSKPEEYNKLNAFIASLERLKEKVNDNEDHIFINDTAYFVDVEEDAFRYTGKNWTLGEKGFTGFRMKYSDLIEIFKANVQTRQDIKKLNNISGLAKQHASYFIKAYQIILSDLKEFEVNEKIERKNYVIIIDEINRANISRVFGELITLIEEDKRSHGKIPMRVTLPSGDSFIVPSNLYIIGTMNTADKSISLLDIALRRRFEFVPMYPNTQIEGVNSPTVLETINAEIIKRKGHDFTIGHAYFMGDNYSLEKTINSKVIPLLLEYFMNDEKEVATILKAAEIEVVGWPMKMKTT
jgi:hypothetical protein